MKTWLLPFLTRGLVLFVAGDELLKSRLSNYSQAINQVVTHLKNWTGSLQLNFVDLPGTNVFSHFLTKSACHQSRLILRFNCQFYCKLNYHKHKIRQTLACNIRNYWTAVLTLLDFISSVYCDVPHWRSNQRPQNAEPKLYDWATGPYRTQATPNQLHGVIAHIINPKCLISYIRTIYIGHSRLQGHIFPRGLEIRIRVIITSWTRELMYIFFFK